MLPARARRPRNKAKVEQGVLLSQRFMGASLRNRQFFSFAKFSAAIAEVVERLNECPFKKLAGNRRAAFERLDRPVLRALPASGFEHAAWLCITVNVDLHMEVYRHCYGVPHPQVREKLDIRVSATTVELFARARRVALHVRSFALGKFTIVAQHVPKSYRAHAQWPPRGLHRWRAGVGACTERLIERLLKARPHPEHGYRACLGLMRLQRRYGPERLEAACERCLVLATEPRNERRN